jgi:WD40 repeat protein
LVSGSADETVKLWNPKNGECLKTLHGHTRGVWSVALNYEGSIIASSSQDETIRVWDIKTGECLKILRVPRPYEGMSIKDIRGLTEAAKASLKALGAVEIENK